MTKTKPGDANKAALKLALVTIFGEELIQLEYKFHPVRRWRFDYAVPSIKLGLEYNGHAGFVDKFGQSGHSSIKGLTNDAEKINSAIGYGWRVLQFTAFHFRPQDRIKHNLTSVTQTIMNALSAMQNEQENTLPTKQ